MPDIVTATKVTSRLDWEGIYVDGELEYENHTAGIGDVELKSEKAIGDMETIEVNMSKLGITSLPSNLEDVERKLEFCETVVKNKDEWEEKIRQAFNSFNHPLSTDEMISEIGIKEEEFDVIMGCFMPEGVSNNNTALGDTAILANAEDENGKLTSEYVLMDSDNACSYE